MAKFKTTKVYFYQLVPKIPITDSKKVTDYKKDYAKAFMFSTKTECKVSDGSVSAIKGKKLENGLIGGTIIYTLEENLPPRYDPATQSPAELDLKGFRGLGYDAAYVYDPELMVLVLENKRPGVTLNNLQNLIFLNNNIPGFDYKPICYSDSYQKFLQSKGVKSLKMKMLRITTEPDKKEYKRSIKEVKDLVDELNGSQITIQVSARNKKETYLDKGKIQDMAQQVLSNMGLAHPIESFELKIEDVDSEKIVPIDLITGRIFEFLKIEKVRLINKFSVGEKIEQIQGHMIGKREAIKKFINE